MLVNVALHVPGARVRRTGVLAAAVDASLVRRAVGVSPAAEEDAGDPWIAAEAGWTFTDSLVIYSVAFRVLPAGGLRWRAHWDAAVLHARV